MVQSNSLSCVTLDQSCSSWRPQRDGVVGRGQKPLMLKPDSNPDHSHGILVLLECDDGIMHLEKED